MYIKCPLCLLLQTKPRTPGEVMYPKAIFITLLVVPSTDHLFIPYDG